MMRKQFSIFFGIYCLFTICGMNVYAVNPPNAGSILRETEKKEIEVREEEPVLYKPAKAKEAKKGETIFIKGFKFAGTKIVFTTELKKLLRGFTNRDVDIAEFDVITNMVADYYAEKNYIVRVLIPEQEIKNGIVEIKIVMGHLEGFKVSGKKAF